MGEGSEKSKKRPRQSKQRPVIFDTGIDIDISIVI
jgi:hypothetical protein